MPVEIVVPQIGEAVAELTIVAWHKQVGDTVKKGDVLFEVDSDKAIVEVDAFTDGTLVEILVDAGSAVMPQDVVARMTTENEGTYSPAVSPTQQPVAASQPDPAMAGVNASPIAQRMAADMGVALDRIEGTGRNGRITVEDVQRHATPQLGAGRILASPKARRIAHELNVGLAGLNGTGVGGLVVVRDVEAAASTASKTTTAPTGNLVEISRLRQTIAARMSRSKQQVPHFYLIAHVDMTGTNQLRRYCRDTLGWDRAPSYTEILVRACALTMSEMAELNRSYSPRGYVQRQAIAIGVAISVDGGLLVPSIPDANRLNLKSTGDMLHGLVERARQGKLKPDDLGEKSLVISNLGMYGVDAFIAIVDIPDPMILAVGQVADQVVAVDGEVTVRPMCTLTLSADHRVLDGVLGAQFLGGVKKRLEKPFDILG